MTMARLRTSACLVAAAALSACMHNGYYVKTDQSVDVMTGLAHLQPPAQPSARLDLGVTFKAAGKVLSSASDALYRSVREGLRAKGRWDVRRVGAAGDDFSSEIAAAKPVSGDAMPPQWVEASQVPRVLVVVEDAPDYSTSTLVDYIVSGVSQGTYTVNKPVDRYDVTVSYRDGYGIDHLYHSHQDLVYATGSKLFGTDEQAVAGLKHYDTPLEAFNAIVDNSVNGARRTVINVGQPSFGSPGTK